MEVNVYANLTFISFKTSSLVNVRSTLKSFSGCSTTAFTYNVGISTRKQLSIFYFNSFSERLMTELTYDVEIISFMYT